MHEKITLMSPCKQMVLQAIFAGLQVVNVWLSLHGEVHPALVLSTTAIVGGFQCYVQVVGIRSESSR